jgi:hypothetical protein
MATYLSQLGMQTNQPKGAQAPSFNLKGELKMKYKFNFKKDDVDIKEDDGLRCSEPSQKKALCFMILGS